MKVLMGAIPTIVWGVACFYFGVLIMAYRIPLTPEVIQVYKPIFTPLNTEQCGSWCITEGVEDGYKMELGQ